MYGATFKSFDGTTLATADYTAKFLAADNRALQTTTNAVMVRRGHRASVYATQEVAERYFVLTVAIIDYPNLQSFTNTLLALFDTESDELKRLVVTDSSARDWYVDVKVVNHAGAGYGIHKFTLAAPDGIWTAVTASTATWNPLASPDDKVVTVGGTHPALPVFTITPATLKTGGLPYRRFIAVRNQTDRDFANYPVCLTGTGLDTAALVTAGKMQADGDDIRVYVDGKKEVYWLGGINTTTTKIWSNLDLPAKIEPVLEGALGAGALTEIQFEVNATTKAYLRKLPPEGILQIESEFLTYSAVDVINCQVTGIVRGAFWTTAAAHADALTAYWIPYDIRLGYGNSTANAPAQGVAEQPMFALDTSTNTSHVYASFTQGLDADQPISRRTGSWVPQVIDSTGGESGTYRGNRGAQPRLATEMGLTALVALRGDRPQAERFVIAWNMEQQAGITNVAMDGERYRNSTQWANKALLQVSANGRQWDDSALTIATAAALSTWGAWSFTGALGATYRFVRLLFAGTLAAVADRTAMVEVENCTLTLDSAAVPSVSLGAENANSYRLEARMRNVTTSEMFDIDYLMFLGESVRVDCSLKTAVNTDQGVNIFRALDIPVQNEWMTLQVGNNTLRFTETGLADVDIAISWHERDGGL